MNNIVILGGIPITDEWQPITFPDDARRSVSFQLESLGVGHFSFDGVVGMKFVGTGERLEGNFSMRTMYFKSDEPAEVLQVRVQDL